MEIDKITNDFNHLFEQNSSHLFEQNSSRILIIAVSIILLLTVVNIIRYILRCPFEYPYFIRYFDVTGKKKFDVYDMIDIFLDNEGFEEIKRHSRHIKDWEEQCQNKIYRSILRRYRHKQFQKINDSENAYQFICFTTEIVYEYKNLKKITYTEFKKIRICSCNYEYLQQRDQKLKNPKPKKNMNTNKSRGSEQTMRYTVTERVKTIKQPRGGFINSKNYETIPLENGIESLHPQESPHATVIGIAVDYMTRYMTGTSLENAFEVSLKGARNINEFDTAIELLHNIQGLDDYSITCAIRLAAYDVHYRTASYRNYQSVNNIFPSSDTIENLRVMVQRSMDFFDKYGPKIKDGITFEGGYTNIIVKGDGDFMTNDTLWDFKTSKNKPNKDHWLQLLIYWRMGMHSIHPEFSNIKYIGIYNPRLNCVYRYNLSKLSKELIEFIDKDVIGY